MANKRYLYLIDQLIRLEKSDGIVVDCGCGNGIGSRYLIDAGYKVFSYDISEDVISQCKERGVNSTKGDITDLSIADNFADIFVCSETLEHLTKEQSIKASEEIKRICKNNGIICITVPENEKICLSGYGHKQYLSRDDVIGLFPLLDIVFEGIFCKKKGRCNRVIFFRNSQKEVAW